MINKLTPIASLVGRQTNPVQSGERSPLVPQLQTGQIVSATVVESRGQNVFLLEMAGTRFSVQAGTPLSKGEQLRFQVLSTNPLLELQKIEDPLPAQIRRTLPLTAEPVNLSPLLQKLETTFFSGPRATPEQLAEQGNTPLSGQRATAGESAEQRTTALPGPRVPAGLFTEQKTPVVPGPRAISEQAALQRSTAPPAVERGITVQGTTPGSTQTAQPLMEKMEAAPVAQLVRQGHYRVQATVLENQGENRSLVRIGRESYLLDGPVGARQGESRVLELRSLQPVVSFLPVGEGGDPVKPGQPLILVSEGQQLPALVRALQLPLLTGLDLLHSSQQQVLKDFQLLQPAQLQESGAGELLKKGLEQLGIRSEAMVAQGRSQETAGQLKTLLAEITKIFQGQEEISASASRLLSTLENSQFLQAGLNNDSIFLFPLPFSFVEKGYLLVEGEGSGQGGEGGRKKSFSCTLHLSLEGLGDVRVNCIQNEEAIRISFFLGSPEKAEFVAGFDADLKDRISAAPLLSLSFGTGADSPGPALLQKVLPGHHSMLETRI
ncbi:MAG: hypothetical protein KJ804_12860 [Proteobacteria bacterium]|nr:hypothetical protein [Pseudomonadota bacterium]MBU1059196.1 hypothetical protein [Pseudomonadota bacterium]